MATRECGFTTNPYQKGACEVNHELIRRILPKGSSFDELTQQDIILMMNHINSYKRKKLNNRSHTKRSAFTTEKMCLRNWDAHQLPPRTSS